MNSFKRSKQILRLVRLQRFIGSLVYPILRDRVERQSAKSPDEAPVEIPGKLLQAESTPRGGKFYFDKAELEITFLTDDLVRVDWKPGILPIPYGIVRSDWPEITANLSQTEDGWILSTNDLKISIKDDGSIAFTNSQGQVLRSELPPHRQGETWTHQAKLREEERIYGLGERAASLDLRRPKSEAQKIETYQLWHYDAGGIYSSGTDPLYLCIPVYIGLHQQGSYLVFYENTYSGNATFADVAKIYFEGGALRYYFTSGTLPKLLERYSELTGKPPLPPRWAFGYHQSRWGYETEAEVRKVVQGFADYDLPLSAIHLDIDCKDDFRSFTIDPDRFPKLADFNQELAAKGVRLIAIVNPGIKADRKSKLFQEGKAQEIFCTYPDGNIVLAPVWPGMCAFPDFTNPLARHWWSRQYEYLLDLGVTGFWHDMNEPGVFTLWGDATLPRSCRHSLEGRGGTHLEAHNVYGLQQARAGYEALCKYRSQQRPFIVSRSGWAGLQRYAWTWTGDVETSWQGLRQTIPTILGMSLAGIPYTGPDIGGFKGDPTDELYLRWFQMASFLTFCRTHSANNVKPRTPWSYGERILDIVREFLRLRYRLIPYFYTLAWEANQKGYPPIRPLFWCDPDDERLWDVEDAFAVGNALLVYPIVQEGTDSREVILPKGDWYCFWADRTFAGSTQIQIAAPLERIPLLVKAGTILPMEVDRTLILHLYPSIEGSCAGSLYSDAGDGYGEWRLDKFSMIQNENHGEITWQAEGNYPFTYEKVQLHFHGFQPQQLWVDGKEITTKGEYWEWDSFQKVSFSR